MHQRALIRQAMQKILRGKTNAENRVYTNQTTPSWVEDLPVLLIYSRSEDNDVFNEAPREHKRVVNMVVEAIAVGIEEPNEEDQGPDCKMLDDLLDELAEQIECELSKDDTLGTIPGTKRAIADDLNLSSTEFEFVGDGSQPLGSVRLVYQVTYYTNYPASIDKQSGVTDFSGADVDWKVGHDANQEGNESPDNVVEANDSVDIP